MAKHKFKPYYQVREIFSPNKHKQFKKGEFIVTHGYSNKVVRRTSL